MSNVQGEFDFTPTESETTRTVGNLTHGSRETPATSAVSMIADRSEKAKCHKPDMHVAGESDSSIVPGKPANKGGAPPPAESAEGRGLTGGNVGQSLLARIQRRNADGSPFAPRSRGLLGVREAARKDKELKFNNLLEQFHFRSGSMLPPIRRLETADTTFGHKKRQIALVRHLVELPLDLRVNCLAFE